VLTPCTSGDHSYLRQFDASLSAIRIPADPADPADSGLGSLKRTVTYLAEVLRGVTTLQQDGRFSAQLSHFCHTT
jgi:hypothetical protein